MKKSYLRYVAAVAVMGQLLFAAPAVALEPDKVAHFGGASVLAAGIDTLFYHYSEKMGIGHRAAASAGLAVLPGLGIEISDEFSSGNYFSWSDLAADGLGAITGAVLGELVNGQFWISASGKQIRLFGRW